MQKQKKIFCWSQEKFWIKLSFGIGHPPAIHQMQCICVGRAQGSQIFKRNSIISIRSKVIAFIVILLFPHGPHGPHVIPIVPTSSPHHPHIVPIAPRRSPCGPHGCGLHGLCGLQRMLSPWSPSRPHHPHVIPIIPTSSSHHLEGPHIMPNPHIPTPSTPPPPCGVGGPKSVKMQ